MTVTSHQEEQSAESRAATRWRNPGREGVALAIALVVFAAIGLRWLWLFRRGQPLDIDEAGYLVIAAGNHHGWETGGVEGWLDAVFGPSIQAPLMTAVTTPFFAVLGTRMFVGFLVALACGMVTGLAVYGLGRSVGGRRVAWLSLAATLATPELISYSRAYHFGIASTATTALALWMLTRSEAFGSRRWSVVAGACFGLVALSRTISVAFLPAVVIVAGIGLLARPSKGRAVNILIAGAVAALVAGPWYWVNGRAVWAYLYSFGYGARRTEYGEGESVLSPESWMDTVEYALQAAALPMVLFWAAGLLMLVAAVVVESRRSGLRHVLAAGARSRLMPCLVWIAFSVVVLTSTGNKGSAFLLPLVPALSVVSAWSVSRWRRPVGTLVAVALCAVLAVNTLASSDLRTPLATPRTIELPGLGGVPLVSGQGTIQIYVADAQVERLSSPAALLRHGSSWVRASAAVAERLQEAGGAGSLTVFGFRHRLVNVNTVQAYQLFVDRPPLPMTMISPLEVPNDVEAMTNWLTVGTAASACTLLTARGDRFEFEPVVDAHALESAAQAAGFARDDSWSFPDGRTVVAWRRAALCPA